MLLEQFFPPVEIALVLEPEELALPLLKYLVAMGHRGREPDLNIRNFYAGSEVDAYAGEKSDEMSRAIVEAWMWLEREGMLAPYLRKGREWVSVTRRGAKLAEESDIAGYVRSNLIPKQSLDPVLADKVWPLFIRGDYDTAVFQAFKEVEIRARTAASLSPESYGTSLMRDAFHPENGVLTDSSLPSAERQTTSDLFAGAIGLFKNPASHRDVDWNDPAECAELIYLANHLLRMVEKHADEECSRV